MQVRYDPNLVEQTVFLATHQDRRAERELHSDLDPLYSLPEGQAREAEFRKVYGEFFARLGLGSVVRDLLAEHPLIEREVAQCVVREAPRSRAECAELYVRASNGTTDPMDRTLIIQICARSALNPEGLVLRMRRELLHVADMLDERFGYRQEAFDGPPSRQNLDRDRYRVLWDVYTEGRLTRRGKGDEKTVETLKRAFERTFRGRDSHSLGVFNRVLQATELTHQQILQWARSTELLFGDEVPQAKRSGELCPLCSFPTTDWFSFDASSERRVIEAIRSDFTSWSPEKGACRQCAEVYASIAADKLANAVSVPTSASSVE